MHALKKGLGLPQGSSPPISSAKKLQSMRDYTIGWIAILPHEMMAATTMLDEKHDWPKDYKRDPKDTNQYHLGRIGQHNVVVASPTGTNQGNAPAVTVVSNLVRNFPNVRTGILVGVGVGLPRVKNNQVQTGSDIRLGDVVVSKPAGTNPGVVEYTLGKDKSKLERVGLLAAPPAFLRQGASTLTGIHRVQGADIQQVMEEMLQRHPKLRAGDAKDGSPAFIHQGLENDHLFDGGKEISRVARPSTAPMVHYGTIASGGSVPKSAVTRETLLKYLSEDCICFETEAARLQNQLPCLVIKGICDYADSHKNDRWQSYAAATAAAYAKILLMAVQPQGMVSEKA